MAKLDTKKDAEILNPDRPAIPMAEFLRSEPTYKSVLESMKEPGPAIKSDSIPGPSEDYVEDSGIWDNPKTHYKGFLITLTPNSGSNLYVVSTKDGSPLPEAMEGSFTTKDSIRILIDGYWKAQIGH